MRGSKECHNAEEDCAATGMRQRAPRRWMSRFRVTLSQFLLCEAGDINPKTLALALIVLPLSLAVASSCFSQPVEGVLHGTLTNLGVEPSRRGQTKKNGDWILFPSSLILFPFPPLLPRGFFFPPSEVARGCCIKSEIVAGRECR